MARNQKECSDGKRRQTGCSTEFNLSVQSGGFLTEKFEGINSQEEPQCLFNLNSGGETNCQHWNARPSALFTPDTSTTEAAYELITGNDKPTVSSRRGERVTRDEENATQLLVPSVGYADQSSGAPMACHIGPSLDGSCREPSLNNTRKPTGTQLTMQSRGERPPRAMPVKASMVMAPCPLFQQRYQMARWGQSGGAAQHRAGTGAQHVACTADFLTDKDRGNRGTGP